jgi:hypothetical protein
MSRVKTGKDKIIICLEGLPWHLPEGTKEFQKMR